MISVMRKWLNEPVLRFLILGGLLGVASDFAGGDRDQRIIVMDSEQQLAMAREFSEEFLHLPDTHAMEGMINEALEEEVLYREALHHGLDQQDPVVRKRLIQKMRLIVEAESDPGMPDATTLASWYEAHTDRYMLPPSTSFRAVYFAASREGTQPALRARKALLTLAQSPDASVDSDPFLAGKRFVNRDEGAIDRVFGAGFANHLKKAPVGAWYGPLTSIYGHHLVYVETRAPAQQQPLAAVEADVRNDWRQSIVQEKQASAIATLLSRYTVRRGEPPDDLLLARQALVARDPDEQP